MLSPSWGQVSSALMWSRGWEGRGGCPDTRRPLHDSLQMCFVNPAFFPIAATGAQSVSPGRVAGQTIAACGFLHYHPEVSPKSVAPSGIPVWHTPWPQNNCSRRDEQPAFVWKGQADQPSQELVPLQSLFLPGFPSGWEESPRSW